MNTAPTPAFSGIKVYALAILRIAIGWHFLFEGISKLFTPSWSSADYLLLSNWIFAGFFHWIAGNAGIIGYGECNGHLEPYPYRARFVPWDYLTGWLL